MQEAIIYLDPESPLNLQNQIRQKLVDGILTGAFAPGARHLDVARNTVVIAYQQLVAEGYLVSRQRSGIFVNQEMLDTRVGHSADTSPARTLEKAAWRRRIKNRSPARDALETTNWREYPYPFIDGNFDADLFPVAEWREANRLALGVSDAREWFSGGGDADDALLNQEIRTKILTRRGESLELGDRLGTLPLTPGRYRGSG